MEMKLFWRALFSRKIVIVAAVIICMLVLCAILAPLLSPYDPYEQNLRARLQSPTLEHFLGTDSLGRDILSRIIYGSRVSLLVGIFTVLLGCVIGTSLGLLAGYYGGIVDNVIMRITEALMAIPPIMLALSIGVALGGGLKNIIISLGIALVPSYIRMVRGQVLSVKSASFVTAGKVIGSRNTRIMLRHILPNCLSPIIVIATMSLGMAIMVESSLSFIGLGVAPPTAAWGSMVSEGYKYLIKTPVYSIAPGFAIMLVVLSFNILGDGLRDAMDPRLRGAI